MAVMHPIGARLTVLVVAVLAVLWLRPAAGQEIVHFRSADDNGAGQPPTELEGRLFRPNGEGPFPALVGLPGCGGMMRRNTNELTPLYISWGASLADAAMSCCWSTASDHADMGRCARSRAST